MNKKRLSDVKEVLTYLNEAKINLNNCLGKESDCFDNMPENLQCSRNGDRSSDAIDNMEEALEKLDEAIELLNDIY